MAGLIAMCVLSDQAGDIRQVAYYFRGNGEQAVEVIDEGLLSAKELDKSVDVMWCEETVLPSGRFRIGTADSEWVERCFPVTVLSLAPEETGTAIEDMNEVLRPLDEGLVVCLMSQGFS